MPSQEKQILYAIATAIVVVVSCITVLITMIFLYYKRRSRLQLESMQSVFNSVEKERTRIAHDLHDDLGSTLSAIKLQLQALQQRGDARFIAHNTERFIDDAMQKLRGISFNIAPRVLERSGLQEAILELKELLEQSSGLHIAYHYDAPSMEKEQALHVYRIVQEIFNNVIKHAHAGKATCHISGKRGCVLLALSDDGGGFNPAAIKGKGEGLHTIRSRINVLKGRMQLYSAPGKGTRYFFKIPIHE